MTEEQKYIIELSSAVISDKSPSLPPANLDWDYIWNKALEQNISGLLASVILKLPKENQPENLQLWRNVVIKTTYLMSRKNAEFERMISVLGEYKIHPICLKGCMIKTLYKNPFLRVMGDFDLFIEESDRSSVLQIFEKEGYQTKSYDFMIKASKGEIAWEIFTTLEQEFKTDTEYWDNCLRMHACMDQNGYLRLDQTYDFAYTALHAAKHFLNSGSGIRPLLDLALMLKNYDDIDFYAVEELCKSQEMSKVIDYIYNVVDKVFGIPVCVEYKELDTEPFLENMLQYGVFGRSEQVRPTAGDEVDISIVKRRLFPDAKTLSREYKYLKKFPILLPVAWIERVIKSVFVRKRTIGYLVTDIKKRSVLKKEKDYWLNRLDL